MLAAALFVSPAAAQDATLVLQPSTNWQLDYADDSCRLARQFGEGEDRVAFYIERYQPGDSFFLLVAGKPLRARNPHAKGVIRFGPDGAEATHWQTGQLGEFDPALLVNSMWVRYIPRDPDAPRAKLPIDAVRNSLDPATEAAITWLEVKRGSDRVVRLALGSMGEPLAAMRSCTDDLLKHWGVDIEAHRSLSRAVTPKSDPTRWVRTSDYPPDLAGSGEQGLVQFRLSIGADGKPTQCHIQRSTRPEGFDAAVCAALMKRAEFEPALDRQGQAIASFWHNSVRFQVD